MKRASILAVAPIVAILSLWAIPGSAAAEDTPKDNAAAAAKDTPPEIPEVNDAWNLFKERDAEGALKVLKKVCKKHPEISPAHIILARFFRQANAAAGMRNALETAVKENPNDPEAYLFLADLAMRDRHYTEAGLLYEKAASLVSKYDFGARKKNLQIQVLAGLGMIAAAREDWKGAQQQLDAWLQLDPKSVDGMQQLGICLLRQNNVTGGLEQLVKAYKVAKENLAAENAKQKDPKDQKELEVLPPEATVAQFFWQTKDQDNAMKWWTQALREYPRDANVRLRAAQWAWETGQLVNAEKQAAAAMQLKPQSLDALILRGLIARYQKNYKAAEDYCQKAVLLKPNLFAATNNLALALVEQDNEDKRQRALEYAGANAQQYQKTNQAGEAYSTLGWVLYKLDRLDDAEKYLRGAISGGQFSLDTAYYLARVLSKRGVKGNKDAINLLETAIKTPGPFAYRDDAKALLAELKK
jgi:tetratricopeptide (TPR) repeat protein